MKKIRLDLSELKVESFVTSGGPAGAGGTVFGMDITNCGDTCDGIPTCNGVGACYSIGCDFTGAGISCTIGPGGGSDYPTDACGCDPGGNGTDPGDATCEYPCIRPPNSPIGG